MVLPLNGHTAGHAQAKLITKVPESQEGGEEQSGFIIHTYETVGERHK